MTYFEWSDKYDLHVDSMNNEHKILISLMNRLHRQNGEGASRAELATTLDELADFTVKHFSDEERYMESIEYPGLHTHKIIHKDLVSTLLDHKAAFDSGGELTSEFFQFLKLWLSAHIRGIDMKYARHANGVSA